MTVTCRVCGTENAPDAVRCQGELPDGTRCGKDLVDQGQTSAGSQTPFGGGR